jgi:hypothetical protein
MHVVLRIDVESDDLFVSRERRSPWQAMNWLFMFTPIAGASLVRANGRLAR